jgi:putative membrane protein
MKTLSDLLKGRPKKETYDPPVDLPLDQTSGGAPSYDFPPELIRELAGKTETQISSTLSKFRTGLSEHRTHMSEHRTDLSEHRTDLSDYRTELSQRRTALSDARSHMANERTHMAGIRTAVALLSFGITLNRFSITLEEANRLTPGHGTALRDSANIGMGMVILGIIILGMSLWRYMKVRHQIDAMSYEPPRASLFILSTLLILLGAASTIIMFMG